VFESVLAFVLDLVREHGPLVLFLAAFLENALLLSWAVPGETLLAVGGYFIQRGELRFEVAWAYVFVGVLCGDQVGYLVGRYGGRQLVHRLPFKRLLARVETLIRRHGGWVVLCGRFSGALRPAVLFTVGTMGLPYRRFWAFELLGAAAWSALWLVVGVLGGTLLDHFGELGSSWGPRLSVGSILLGGLLGWVFRDRLKRLLFGDDEPTEAPAESAA
jgi:membrane protein DedA with SNARE-associated domain